MYITCLAGSPWAKTVSFLANSPTFLPRPVESRKRFTSKTRFFDFARGRAPRTLADTLRLAGDSIVNDSRGGIRESVQNCTVGGASRGAGDSRDVECLARRHSQINVVVRAMNFLRSHRSMPIKLTSIELSFSGRLLYD